jgi:hypothetical protein
VKKILKSERGGGKKERKRQGDGESGRDKIDGKSPNE